MTHRTLSINIRCGEKTCAWTPGKFCAYVRTRRFGTVFICDLFGPLEQMEGWLIRHPSCLAASVEVGRLNDGA